jgi:rifampicin phosphotransferase
MSDNVRWEAPGPGEWQRDRSHMPPGTTQVTQHLMREAMPAGLRRVMAELGVPLDAIQCDFVNGQMYTRMRPLIRPDSPSSKLPPLPLLKLAVRLHPEMRRRARTAAQVREAEPWVAVIDAWHGGERARIQAASDRLQAVDLSALDDAGVLSHVRENLAHCRRQFEHHFWLHGYDLGPLGNYLAEAMGWGIEPEVLLSLLEGASPSTTAPVREAAAIRELVDVAVRDGAAEPRTLDELRALSPEIDAAVEAYLAPRAWVLFSRYDVDGVTLGERPDLVLAAIRSARPVEVGDEVSARAAAVRDRIPTEHRDRFDTLLRQARSAMDLRDDNGPITAERPMGLLRRALLELGARLVARGDVDDPTLAFEVHHDEFGARDIVALPSGRILRSRRAVRDGQRGLVGPSTLGSPEPSPPLEVLPEALAAMVATVQATVEFLGMDGARGEAAVGLTLGIGAELSGSGIGTATVRAVARVASTAEEALDVVAPGEVLVVTATTPAFNLVLTMVGALVTAEGGPMSHAAVISRELGIPAVIGVVDALSIPDGSMVEVDPVAGVVRLV